MKPKILSLKRFIILDLIANTAYLVFCGLFIAFSFVNSESDNALAYLFFVFAVLSFVLCAVESHAYDNEGLLIFGKLRYLFAVYRVLNFVISELISSLSATLVGVGVGIGVLALVYYAIFAPIFFKFFRKRLQEFVVLTLYDDSKDNVRLVRSKFFIGAVFAAAVVACAVWLVTEITSAGDYIWVSAELIVLCALLAAYNVYAGVVIFKNYKKDESDKKLAQKEKKPKTAKGK